MRVYLAAPFVERDTARVAKAFLQGAGHEVTSRWIDYHTAEPLGPDESRGEAEADIDDIEQADVLVALDGYPCSTGRNFEIGYAVARGKSVILVAPKPHHIFNHLVSVTVVPTLEEAATLLDGMNYLPQHWDKCKG